MQEEEANCGFGVGPPVFVTEICPTVGGGGGGGVCSLWKEVERILSELFVITAGGGGGGSRSPLTFRVSALPSSCG